MPNKSKRLTSRERKKRTLEDTTKIDLNAVVQDAEKAKSKLSTPFQEELGNNAPIVHIDPKRIKQVTSFAKKHLRPASLEWPERNQAIADARTERGKIKCAHCGDIIPTYREVVKDGRIKKATNFHVDHIEPVQPIGVEIDLITWIYRLFCPKSNFQILCIPCHDVKTQAENTVRRIKKKIY